MERDGDSVETVPVVSWSFLIAYTHCFKQEFIHATSQTITKI